MYYTYILKSSHTILITQEDHYPIGNGSKINFMIWEKGNLSEVVISGYFH